MTRYLIPLLTALVTFFSCNTDTRKPVTADHKNTIYKNINVDCYSEWDDKTHIDSSFFDFRFKIISRCNDKVIFIDTVEHDADTCFVRHWKSMEFIVDYLPFVTNLKINKGNYFDSLATDLYDNGFLTPPRDFYFNMNDSSISFKTFIGHADSDVGDVYVLRIDKSGQTKVIAVETSDMEDDID